MLNHKKPTCCKRAEVSSFSTPLTSEVLFLPRCEIQAVLLDRVRWSQHDCLRSEVFGDRGLQNIARYPSLKKKKNACSPSQLVTAGGYSTIGDLLTYHAHSPS